MSNKNDDIRSFLTSGSRAKVPPRNARLNVTSQTPPPSEEEIFEETPSNSPSTSPDFAGLQAELDKLPEIGKRLAIHLEAEIRTDLLRWCDEAELTPETLIEAAIADLRERPDARKKITADALARLKQRKRAGLIRRTLSMAQKYG